DGREKFPALLVGHVGVARRERPRDAVVDVAVEDAKRETVERRRHRADLREHVDAVPVLLEHPLDPAHLALDPVQPLHEGVLLRGVAVGVGHAAAPSSRGLRNRRSRRLFVTTKTLEKAIAAAATIGLRTPATASGIAATL